MGKREQGQRRYMRLKESGMCICCGHEKARPGKVLCQICAERSNAIRKENTEYCLTHGYCTNCHQRLSEEDRKEGFHTCAKCREYSRVNSRERQQKIRERKKIERENQRSVG